MDVMLENKDIDTRARIVAQAEAFFRQYGYQKTTVADIAKALKMSPANVYRFFDSKKSINEAVAELLMRGLEEAAQAVVESDAAPPAKLRQLLVTISTHSSERYTVDRRMHDMVEAALDESWAIVEAHLHRIDGMIERVIAQGMATGDFDVDDATLAARCVHASFVKFCHPRFIVECADMDLMPQIDIMTRFLLRALGHKVPLASPA